MPWQQRAGAKVPELRRSSGQVGEVLDVRLLQIRGVGGRRKLRLT